MEQREQWNYLFSIIKYSLDGTNRPQVREDADWEYLYRVCKWHKIEAVVCNGLEQMRKHDPKAFENDCVKQVYQKFSERWQLETARDTVQHFSQAELLDAFERAGVDCLPLKGILLKECYPQTNLRMMADLDILFRDEQKETVDEILLKLGYEKDHESSHHDVYFRKPFMNIEMHHDLIEPDSKYGAYYKDPWKRAKLQNGKQHVYEYGKEDFYIFVIVHMAKHFGNGGCGIRSLIDLRQFDQKAEAEGGIDRTYVALELKKLGLDQFEKAMKDLVGIWLEDKADEKNSAFYDGLMEFMIGSGIYGTLDHYRVQAVVTSGKRLWTGQLKVWLNAIFLPFDGMKGQYRYLENYPWLLPFAWIQRIFRTCFHRKGRAEEVLKGSTVDVGEAQSCSDLFDRLGLL